MGDVACWREVEAPANILSNELVRCPLTRVGVVTSLVDLEPSVSDCWDVVAVVVAWTAVLCVGDDRTW